MFLLDLAVPRNITEDTADLPHVTLCNIDALQSQCEAGQLERQVAAMRAETMGEQEISKFIRWSDAQQTKHFSTQYRKQMQAISKQELSRAKQQLKTGEPIHDVLDQLTHRLFKKLTHLPTLSLRQAALNGCTELLDFAHLLYASADDDTHH